ncbi:MAG TPA: transglycosylase domain-containing protein [Gaiellaceae bacterium]|jgi:penicillin-binding protein 1A|nr:transglycosylase domain-containing protein [Gaiellaceae bacterium]
MARAGDSDAVIRLVRNRKRKREQRRRRHRRNLVLLLAAAAVLAVVVVVAGFGASAAFSESCSLSSLKPVNIGANTFVYAADGSLLGSIPAERNRSPVALERMSVWLPAATVSVEDKRFYEHGGIDYVGIARALWTDLSAGKVVEGGSTITQQLVRNMYTGREQTFDRKLKEACLAIKLSDKWSKPKILQTYLNTVYYGNHAYGVEAASETYFSRHARNLNLAQAALIAGLPQAPSIYDPLVNPKAALIRRKEVLRAMLTAHAITRKEFRWAVHQPLHLKPSRLYSTIKQPYFFSYVIDELESVYGANVVRDGGLRVYTTIEPKLQVDANSAIRETLDESDDPAAAIVSVTPGTGAIRAMTAVIPGNKHNQFNLTSQSARQAGSTFKTFVLTAAIEKGIDPNNTYYTSAPFTCTTGPWCIDDYKAGKPWQVTTFDHTYAGSISITNATLRSDNTVYAQLTLDVGPDTVYKLAQKLGVNFAGQKPVASIGLGSLSVSPLDMAAAYATFAAGGVYAKPTAIRKVILPNGKVDTTAGWGKPQSKRVMSQGVAWQVNQVLAANAQYGTGSGSSDGVHPNAGKTGTTSDFTDAWFDGYTRDFSTVVWMGYPRGEIAMTDVHGEEVTGATFPVPIWHLYMAAAEKNLPERPFLTPSSYPAYEYFSKGYWGYLDVPVAPPPAATTTTTAVTPAKVPVAPNPKPAPTQRGVH